MHFSSGSGEPEMKQVLVMQLVHDRSAFEMLNDLIPFNKPLVHRQSPVLIVISFFPTLAPLALHLGG